MTGPMALPVLTISIILARVKLLPTLLTLSMTLQGIPVLVRRMPTRFGTCLVMGRTLKCIRPFRSWRTWATLVMVRRVRVMVTLQLGMTMIAPVDLSILTILAVPAVAVLLVAFVPPSGVSSFLLKLFSSIPRKEWPTFPYTTQSRTVLSSFISVLATTSRLPPSTKFVVVDVRLEQSPNRETIMVTLVLLTVTITIMLKTFETVARTFRGTSFLALAVSMKGKVKVITVISTETAKKRWVGSNMVWSGMTDRSPVMVTIDLAKAITLTNILVQTLTWRTSILVFIRAESGRRHLVKFISIVVRLMKSPSRVITLGTVATVMWEVVRAFINMFRLTELSRTGQFRSTNVAVRKVMVTFKTFSRPFCPVAVRPDSLSRSRTNNVSVVTQVMAIRPPDTGKGDRGKCPRTPNPLSRT